MATHNDFGKEAEDLAVDFLEKKGYRILVRNYRFDKAEIDIIAEYENEIIILEVKARATDAFMLPQEAVNKKKIKLLVKAADHYLECNEPDKEVRFDIISIMPDGNKKYSIEHLENAFTAMDAN